MRTVVKVKIPRLECQRCGHKWHPRTEDVRSCPRCHSPRWDEPRPVEEEPAPSEEGAGGAR